MKDIVLDSMIALNLCTPIKPGYNELAVWLRDEGIIRYCNYLYGEYSRCCATSPSTTSIIYLIEIQNRKGIAGKISNEQLKAYKFKPKQLRSMKSHLKDHPILKTVLLSERKILVSKEQNLIDDLEGFPGANCVCGTEIDQINYNAEG